LPRWPKSTFLVRETPCVRAPLSRHRASARHTLHRLLQLAADNATRDGTPCWKGGNRGEILDGRQNPFSLCPETSRDTVSQSTTPGYEPFEQEQAGYEPSERKQAGRRTSEHHTCDTMRQSTTLETPCVSAPHTTPSVSAHVSKDCTSHRASEHSTALRMCILARPRVTNH